MNVLCENVVWIVCAGGPDDPDYLLHFVQLGAPLMLKNEGDDTCLSVAAKRGKYKLVRTLLDLGVSANIASARYTALDRLCQIDSPSIKEIFAATYVFDAGGIRYANCAKTCSGWVHELQCYHMEVQLQTITILGLQRCGSSVIGCNGKDVLRVIARAIWSTRANFR